MTKKRAKNLEAKDIREIVELIDRWAGDITWNKLIDAIERTLFARYTRQSLHAHDAIHTAFQRRKGESAPKGGSQLNLSVRYQIFNTRIARLEAEKCRLEAENARLLEKFAIWSYNAYTHGLDEEALNRPLPTVDRGQTR